ncbi:MAG: T9SS type A sorting domain-containing protein [Chitinophagales bacterium]|nr:T9SS type A sorting domain-containing protein [Chitinophagales bacterium]
MNQPLRAAFSCRFYLYHAGFFNIPSGSANVCVWEVTSFSGQIIFQDTTSGDAFEQGSVLFKHSVSITDSMKASIVITNDTEGIICTIKDTLYWKETVVIPGSVIGNWEVLSGDGGVEEQITSSDEISFNRCDIKLFPSTVHNSFRIEGRHDIIIVTIIDLNGRVMETYDNISTIAKFDVSHYPWGMYLVRFRDDKNRMVGFKRFIKI